MANILDGIEFRMLKAQLPGWRTEENYGEWTACGAGDYFPSGTEFRVAPVIKYVVTDSFDKTVLASEDKNKAMAKVSSMLAEGKFAAIRRDELTSPGIAAYLSDQGIQFRLVGSDKWMNPPYFAGTAVDSPIRFRKRPDNYFSVRVTTGVSMAELTFDDVEELSKYLDRQLRTSENNITITRRSYGI